MTNWAIETEQLGKTFAPQAGWRSSPHKETTAVSNVTLRIPTGELFGLLGPNGAGKTTLTKMLCTLILPTAGQAMIMGHDLRDTRAIRTAVGLVVTDERSFYWRLSGYRNLQFFAALHGLYGTAAQERINQLLPTVGLVEAAERRFSDYSSGMKQRLAIARALLHQPRLLFLDEPSRSLDPTATFQLHELIKRLQAQGVTIFLITHDLAEADKLCDRVAVMYAGQVQTVGSPASLAAQLTEQRAYTVRLAHTAVSQLPDLHPILPTYQTETMEGGDLLLHCRLAETDGRLTAVLDALRAADREIVTIHGRVPSLEEVFRHFTQPSQQ